MKIRSKWWAVCGSDPVWWLILPISLLVVILCGPFWLAGWAIRAMEDWPDWLEDFGRKPAGWIYKKYAPRHNRRVDAWEAGAEE